MQPIVEFSNVSKHYPHYHHITGGLKNLIFNLPKAIKEINEMRFQALKDISFSINKGECVAFIGRNGAGKSTTLGLIAGVLKQNEGRVAVNGRVSPLLELGGGFHPELTGIENIKLNGVLLGLSRSKVDDKLEEIIDFSELGEFIHQPIRTYSSGMLARLGFSVIASLEPEILLIDEVLAVGDARFQEKCLKRMQAFKEEGVTIILVTHSISDVEKLCDRAIWINDNKIKMDESAQEVVKEYIKFFEISHTQSLK
ncbi:MAG: sugar ABC transporter ATP-binding protein [Peredibacter sp.]|nr:sugar ABC transporter ATP-binding protein [Peredibacter sp.]